MPWIECITQYYKLTHLIENDLLQSDDVAAEMLGVLCGQTKVA